MMNIPTNLQYTESHEWVLFLDGTTARVGLTDYAQQNLGGLVYAELPNEGDEVTAGSSFGEVESVKAVSEVLSPFTGTITNVNDDLDMEAERINQDPYGAWLVEIGGISQREELLTPEEYEALCQEE